MTLASPQTGSSPQYSHMDRICSTTASFPLPLSFRRFMEAMFAQDFSSVRIVIGSQPERYGAIAYAQGNKIYCKPGYFEPDTSRGIRLLAHELAHIIQQAQGRTPAPSCAQTARVTDLALEQEADQAADYCVCAIFGQTGAAGAKMPAQLVVACNIGAMPTYRHQPIQCVAITAAQSYQAFKASCWTYLSGFNGTAVGALNHQAHLAHIYNNIYAAYNGHNIVVPAKVALAGNNLYWQMIDILAATYAGAIPAVPPGIVHPAPVVGYDSPDPAVGNDIRIQTGNHWPRLHGDAAKDAYINYYYGMIGGLAPVDPGNADRATRRYLHIYPNPLRNALVPNWRIGFNVPPAEIAEAVRRLVPVMQAQANIGHIKFSAPTMITKPDSVIVYMRRGAAGALDPAYLTTFAAVRDAVLPPLPLPAPNAPAPLNLVQQFGPIWEEFVEGGAEAAEPPQGGGSFGNFRSILAYQAYLLMRKQFCQIRWNAGNYGTTTDALYNHFGIPAAANPQNQNALAVPFFTVRGMIFTGLKSIYNNGTLLTNR